MLCSVVTRCIVLLNFMQQCYMLWCVLACCAVLLHVTRVITGCAVLLDVTEIYYMLCSVVRCYQELLHVVQCCYMCTLYC